MKQLQIGDRSIGEGCGSYIIAEMSCNHRQDYSLAVKTLEAIADSGADAVKLQTCTPEGLTLECDREEFVIRGGTPWDGRTLFELYKETYTPWEWHAPLQELALKLGLHFFSSPFDLSAVEFLSELNVPAYKIASFEAVDLQLIRATARTGKPVIISTGIATESDIDRAIATCHEEGNTQIILLKCTSAYPAALDTANLLQIPELSRRFDCLSGLSDHTEGALAPIGAATLGAAVIEKHFILDRSLGGPDAGFSMEPIDFKVMVDQVRSIEMALGSPTLKLDNAISKKGRMFARSLFVVEDMAKGDVLTTRNVRSIRPGHGLAPVEYWSVLGKRVSRDIERGTPLAWEFITES